MTNQIGLWEHALGMQPRVEHGFCTDDNARALLVVSRQRPLPPDLVEIAAIYLRFVLAARVDSGQFHNRRNASGTWTDEVGSDDCQGRAWWGLGTTARFGPAAWMRQAAADTFATCASFNSEHLRANAYAALGAAEMLLANPKHEAATDLLKRTSRLIAEAARRRIPWPEVRLTYDNARIPEALIAAGTELGDRRLVSTGTRLLEWLVLVETNGDHFSFTPSAGWEPGQTRPGFDQQPLEASAMAAACYRAWSASGHPVWRMRALDAVRWFMGKNDTETALYDEKTGGTHDGLTEQSVNNNHGAESTLAGIAALQIGAKCAPETPEAAIY